LLHYGIRIDFSSVSPVVVATEVVVTEEAFNLPASAVLNRLIHSENIFTERAENYADAPKFGKFEGKAVYNIFVEDDGLQFYFKEE